MNTREYAKALLCENIKSLIDIYSRREKTETQLKDMPLAINKLNILCWQIFSKIFIEFESYYGKIPNIENINSNNYILQEKILRIFLKILSNDTNKVKNASLLLRLILIIVSIVSSLFALFF